MWLKYQTSSMHIKLVSKFHISCNCNTQQRKEEHCCLCSNVQICRRRSWNETVNSQLTLYYTYTYYIHILNPLVNIHRRVGWPYWFLNILQIHTFRELTTWPLNHLTIVSTVTLKITNLDSEANFPY